MAKKNSKYPKLIPQKNTNDSKDKGHNDTKTSKADAAKPVVLTPKRSRKRIKGQNHAKAKASKKSQKEYKYINVKAGDLLVPPLATDHISLVLDTHLDRWMFYITDVELAAIDKDIPEEIYKIIRFETEVNAAGVEVNKRDASGKYFFQKSELTKPVLDLSKEYDVMIVGQVATKAQAEKYKQSINAATSSTSSTSSSSTSLGAGKRKTATSATTAATSPSVNPTPNVQSPDTDELNLYDFHLMPNGQYVKTPKPVAINVKRTGLMLQASKEVCQEFTDDLKIHELHVKKYTELVEENKTHLKSFWNIMYEKLSEASQEKVLTAMGQTAVQAKSELDVIKLRDAIRQTHHPDSYHTFKPRLQAENELLTYAKGLEERNSMAQKENESIFMYKMRLDYVWRQLKKVQDYNETITYARPSERAFVRQIINGVKKTSKTPYEYCQSITGTSVHSNTAPETIAALFFELEKFEEVDLAKQQPKKEKKAERKAKQEQLAEITDALLVNFNANPKKRHRDNDQDQGPHDLTSAIVRQLDPNQLEKRTKIALAKMLLKDKDVQCVIPQAAEYGKQPAKKPKLHDKKPVPAKPIKGKGRPPKKEHVNFNAQEDEDDQMQADTEEFESSEDDESEEERSVTFSNNFNIQSQVLDYLSQLQIPRPRIQDLILMGLAEKQQRYISDCSYEKSTHHAFLTFDKAIKNKYSVAIKGVVVKDDGSSVNITRDRELLIPGSIRKIPKNVRMTVKGTFPGAQHAPKYFAQHKLLGFTIYDPNSVANIISKTYCWSTGWKFRTDNEQFKDIMYHPDLNESCIYEFYVGPEKVMSGIDPTTFKGWNPTKAIKPFGRLSNFIDPYVLGRPMSDYSIPELSQEELDAFAFATQYEGRRNHGSYPFY